MYFKNRLFGKTVLFTLLLLLSSSLALQLYYASTLPDSDSASMSGSLAGGTRIYIKGIGFDPIAPNNQVTLSGSAGIFPCNIVGEGVVTNFLSCDTINSMSTVDIRSLVITVTTNGQTATLPTSGDQFSYIYDSTPLLSNILPSSAIAGSYLYFYGTHRITNVGNDRDLGDIRGLKIGNSLCGRFDLSSATINSNVLQMIKCKQAMLQDGGKYNVSQQVTPGFATNNYKMKKTSFKNQYYQFAVLPSISNISPQTGGIGGQYLTITGTGFSNDINKINILVDGVKCDVTVSTQTQIQCKTKSRLPGTSTLLATTSTNQIRGYTSGSGFKYTKYDISTLNTKTYAGLKSALMGVNSLTVLETGTREQLETPNVDNTMYGQVFQGYFYAPVTGNYRFQGYCDDNFGLYISNVTGSVQIGSVPYIYANYPDYGSNPYYNNVTTAMGAPLLLQGGSYYYMELYSINLRESGFTKVSVQVPNTDTTLSWQTYQVNQITTALTNNPQIMQFIQIGAMGGNYNLKYVETDPNTGKYVQNLNVTLAYNAPLTDFLNALKQFRGFSSYDISGVLTIKDQGGAIVTDPTQGYQFNYTIYIDKLRPSIVSQNYRFQFKFNGLGASIFTQTILQPHSPMMSGSFNLQIEGTSILFWDTSKNQLSPDLPYDIADYTLQSAIRRISRFQNVEVQRKGDPLSSATWIITYNTYNADVPDLVLNGNNLKGGKPGVNPTIKFWQTRKYSSDLLFSPVDYNFLFTAAPSPQVTVTVDGMLSACIGDCSFTFINSVPEIIMANLTGSQLNIGLSQPSGSNFALVDITVNFDGLSCVISSGTIGNFLCQLLINLDNTPKVRAGSYFPQVTVKNIGIIQPASNVTKISIPLVLTTLSPSIGANNGGYQTIVTGHGFPYDLTSISMTLCGKSVTINSVTNIQAKIIVPSCASVGTNSLTANYNSLTGALPFTYNAPATTVQITSIFPTSASPVLKDVLQIHGTGFGSDISAVTVFLGNSSGRVYQMRVLQLNNTYIKTGIPGGLPGAFRVYVTVKGFGDAIPNPVDANVFTYQLVISSISPTSGSAYGGTLINITGINFSPDPLETQVFVGTELNWFCNLETVQKTYITCRTPPRNQYYSNSQNQIFLTNRLILDAKCAGNCMFNYIDNSLSPTISSTSLTQSLSGASLTISGSNFGSSPFAVFTNKINKAKNIVTPTAVTTNSITITIPNIEAGYYSLTIRNDPIGQSNSIAFKVNMNIISVSSTTFSLNGGNVNVIGTGLPNSWPNKLFSLTVVSNSKNLISNVIQSTVGNLKIKLPLGIEGQSYTVTIKDPFGNSLTKSFTQKSASTPNLILKSSGTVTAGTVAISLNRTSLATAVPSSIIIYPTVNPTKQISIIMSSVTQNGNLLNFSIDLKSGLYGFKVFYDLYGWATCDSKLTVTNSSGYTISSGLKMSYKGGFLTILGSNINDAAIISVGGVIGQTTIVNNTHAVFIVPPLITPQTISVYPLLKSISKITAFTTIGDSSQSQLVFDSSYSTNYISSNPTCYVGVDVGSSLLIDIDHIRYFPYPKWSIASNYLQGAVFQGSNDNVAWTQIYQIDSTVHAGWNTFEAAPSLQPFRYIRLSHNNLSQCQIAEIQIYGVTYSNVAVASITGQQVNVMFDDGYTQQTFTNALQFREDATPVINTVSPPNGNVYGGYSITLIGSFLTGGIQVKIDGLLCPIASSTSTTIICTVPARLTLPSNGNSFEVIIDNKKAITYAIFEYVMRWSDIRTWGTDLPPIDNDLIHVPKGMTLYVDQSTPNLAGIVVQGNIIFADESDMTIQAGLITINKGKFTAGTQAKPYQHKLKFLMHGGYYGAQQPIFGNKGIGCMECQFSMYGIPRNPTWTMIASTINPGATTFDVIQDVDWKVGDRIVVASTSFDHNEAEEFTIVSVTTKRQIQVDAPFKFMHFGGIQTYGTHKLQMRAEVGLLTRNILVTGDDQSVIKDYGAHLLMAGLSSNGLRGHIAYTQFTKCGQPAILGRYCIHFHMNGDVMDSYVKGNAVHHSMARVITIHGVHFLHVQKNVGYEVKGHNYFIQDGIQTNNVLEYNLAIKSLQVWNMLQTDISVASFWITNPYNHFRYNHAAGGDFYGFWYEIKPHPDGPSATSDICPMGNPLGQSHDNVAHSYKRFGLRIFKLASRKYPCSGIRDGDINDPWTKNPSYQSKFSNYIIYKNQESGVLNEFSGNVIFDNFTIAQNLLSGMQFYITNVTKEFVVSRNSAIIGVTQGNNPRIGISSSGIITPRTDGFKISNVGFYNFAVGQTVLQTCSKCYLVTSFTNSARQVFIEGITYSSISGKYLKMNGLQREIIYDLDGSYTSTAFDGNARTKATVVNNFKHIADNTACLAPSSISLWGNTLACDNTIVVRRVMLLNPQNFNEFNRIPMKIQLLSNINETVDPSSNDFSTVYSPFQGMEPMIDSKFSWAVPMITGQIYNIWWYTGIDFTHMAIDSSRYFTPTDDGIILKFNYTEHRQFFQIGALHNLNSYFNDTFTDLDPSTCLNGNYYHDPDNRTLQVCVSGKDKPKFEYIDINGIKCRYLCPSPTGQFTRQTFIRKWSNATQWPFGRLPADGENVTVDGNWTIIMDINPARADVLTINGVVYVSDSIGDVTIRANTIWIRAGELHAGQPTIPFPNRLTIELLGNKNDQGIVISPEIAGNKMLVVTGLLNLYGPAPDTVWTKLTQIAKAGTNTITVASALGWQIGDQIVLAPSYSSKTQYQKLKITAINGNVINLDNNLLYNHYGASGITINNTYGELDARTAVGHLTRNITIQSGVDSGWGYRVLIYGYWDDQIVRTGSVNFVGVQVKNGGQYDTEKSAIQVLNVLVNPLASKIIKSSIHDCQSFCMSLSNSRQFTIDNNVFYLGTLFHVRSLGMKQYSFTNNLMIGAHRRYTISVDQQITCYSSWQMISLSDSISVANNLCQGSEGHGFALPHLPCADINSNPFVNNVAGSCKIGFIYSKVDGNCMAGSGIKAYACDICHMGHPPGTTEVMYKNFILADCGRAVTLRFGSHEDNDNTAYLSDSYITAISRPTCSQCYGSSAIDCKQNQALRLLTVTINGQKLPTSFGTGFDVICKNQVFDCKAFLNGVTFENYNLVYGQLPQCSNNFLFRPHSLASDLVGSHHTFNTVCKNCSIEAYGKFDSPDPSQLTWFGGCGKILCTGKNNYLIQDHDGKFLPEGGTLLANNSVIGDAISNCTFYPFMNGYHCKRNDLGVLQYQSIAPDFNTRIMWPVYLKYDGGSWTSVTNGFKQWDWVDGQPQNKRIGRFISVIQYQQIYNMTFQAMPPQDMKLQFQRRTLTGNNSDWIIVKLYYPKPNSIRVQVNGVTIRPLPQTDNSQISLLNNKTVCGANRFFYKNYTIHFVITGDKNCQVRVSLTNSIQLTIHFEMDINTFYSDGLDTKFIDRMCALLNVVDTSRLKIVGIYNGSLKIVAVIQQPVTTDLSNSTATNDQEAKAQEIARIQALLKSLIESGDLNTSLIEEGLGPIISALYQSYYLVDKTIDPTPSPSPSPSPSPNSDPKVEQTEIMDKPNAGVIAGALIGSVILLAIIIVGVVCYCRKRARVINQVKTQPSDQQKMKREYTEESIMDFQKKV